MLPSPYTPFSQHGKEREHYALHDLFRISMTHLKSNKM